MRCSLIHHVFDDLKFFSIRAQRTCQHWNQLFVQILVLVQAFLALVRTKLWMHIAGPTAIKLQAIQVPWWRNDHQHPSLLKPACLWTEDSSSCGLLMGAYLQAYISIHFLADFPGSSKEYRCQANTAANAVQIEPVGDAITCTSVWAEITVSAGDDEVFTSTIASKMKVIRFCQEPICDELIPHFIWQRFGSQDTCILYGHYAKAFFQPSKRWTAVGWRLQANATTLQNRIQNIIWYYSWIAQIGLYTWSDRMSNGMGIHLQLRNHSHTHIINILTCVYATAKVSL